MEVIMKTSVIGFPRIGTLRELKFASEKYFRKEIEVKELLHTAELLRKEHWAKQKNTGINYISSNDFSFYDMVLDTAVLLGINIKFTNNSHVYTKEKIKGVFIL